MKISVRETSCDPVEFEGVLSAQAFQDQGLGVRCDDPVQIKAIAQKTANVLTVQAQAMATFSFDCSRCLEPFDEEIQRDFMFHYPIDPSIVDIDLGEEIRQELIAGFQLRTLCQENCRGLCAHCGVDLNKETCECHKKE